MVRIDIKVKKYGIEIRKEIQWNGSKVYFPAFLVCSYLGALGENVINVFVLGYSCNQSHQHYK
jgi:hypothetical protein